MTKFYDDVLCYDITLTIIFFCRTQSRVHNAQLYAELHQYVPEGSAKILQYSPPTQVSVKFTEEAYVLAKMAFV